MDAAVFSATGVQPLLEAMLARMRRAGDTPLQFGINSSEITGTALKEFMDELPEAAARHWEDWQHTVAALDALVERALPGGPPVTRAENFGHNDGEPPASELAPVRIHTGPAAHPVAGWLDQLHTVLRTAHPRAIEFIDLRVRGFAERDLAVQLGLGLRLVQRILLDVRAHWDHSHGKESAA